VSVEEVAPVVEEPAAAVVEDTVAPVAEVPVEESAAPVVEEPVVIATEVSAPVVDDATVPVTESAEVAVADDAVVPVEEAAPVAEDIAVSADADVSEPVVTSEETAAPAAEPVKEAEAQVASEEPAVTQDTAATSVAAGTESQAPSETSDAKQPRASTSESVERKKHRGIMGFFKRIGNSTDEYALGALKSDKVQVELFVMSRCPDAIKVETVFNSVVRELYPILDIQLNFIAKPNPNATYGAECKHGDDECRGNIDELCALAHGGDLPLFWR
ncbi:hypothetical protein IWW35_006407, partial [Coemansia sp. RSA 1878]